MALKATEEFYKHLIAQVVKEVADDPQTSNISTEALAFLEKVPLKIFF